jgi:hypothetical protein
MGEGNFSENNIKNCLFAAIFSLAKVSQKTATTVVRASHEYGGGAPMFPIFR